MMLPRFLRLFLQRPLVSQARCMHACMHACDMCVARNPQPYGDLHHSNWMNDTKRTCWANAAVGTISVEDMRLVPTHQAADGSMQPHSKLPAPKEDKNEIVPKPLLTGLAGFMSSKTDYFPTLDNMPRDSHSLCTHSSAGRKGLIHGNDADMLWPARIDEFFSGGRSRDKSGLHIPPSPRQDDGQESPRSSAGEPLGLAFSSPPKRKSSKQSSSSAPTTPRSKESPSPAKSPL
jgi:hypothetical protein